MFTSDATNKCWCDCNWKENRHRKNDPNYFSIKWKKQHYNVRWSFYVPLSKNIRKWKTYLQYQAKKNDISISIITSVDNKQFSVLFLLQKNVLTKNLISARLVSKVYLFKYILLYETIETSLPVSLYHFDFSVSSVCSFFFN